MGKAEAYVEDYLHDTVEAAGGECFKFTSGVNGVPDRIVVLNGHTVFVTSTREEADALMAALAETDTFALQQVIETSREKYIAPKRPTLVLTALPGV